MSGFQIEDVECTCQRGERRDAVSGHALDCPTHAHIMAELFKPMPGGRDSAPDAPPQPAETAPAIHWRVTTPQDFYFEFYAPHCNADAQGLLAIGGPGEVLAIFAPGQWSRIENMDARGEDGVSRVKAA